MSTHKKILIETIILFVVVIAVVIVTSIPEHYSLEDLVDVRNTEEPFDMLSEIIEKGEVDKLRLHIIYLNAPVLMMPAGVKSVVSTRNDPEWYDYIIVSGRELEDYTETLVRLCTTKLEPPVETSYLDVRTYYAFEYEGDIILDVAFGTLYGVIINDVEVAEHEIFYDVIIPFLSEEHAARYQRTNKTIKEEREERERNKNGDMSS